ncbi:hypothetical protein GPECTOR_25g390 [Gonium pectorale]|uniref:START domain-containing protein n=1 Tax=Gonium pectorale TaxID=33097 RepID=A0A150GG51_GONPE|nr:hypothetical protein GPECTOR_25g390 [Gonium pectorale]|eukprot:KXZ48806.1 hypothetical protein GPECTOR_25g390 [Gonium pectorale]
MSGESAQPAGCLCFWRKKPNSSKQQEHDDLYTLSASSHASHASTAYFSAGGWSHFGDDGEWIGPPSARGGAHASAPHQRVSAAAGAGAGAGGAGLSPGGHGAADSAEVTEHGGASPPAAAFDLHKRHGSGGASRPQPIACNATDGRDGTSVAAAAAVVSATPGSPPAAASPSPRETQPRLQEEQRGGGDQGQQPKPHQQPPQQQREGEGEGEGERSSVLDRVAELYVLQGRPCKACQVLLGYCRAQGVEPDSLQQQLRRRELPDATGLTKMAQSVSDGLADLATNEGWQLVRDDELRLQYRHMPERGLHAFRARCELDAPVEHLVALAREVDLCPTWNKYCTSAHVLKQKSQTDVTVYMSLWVPWPFNDVGFCVDATGADLYEEEGLLAITFGSPNKGDGSEPVQLPDAASGHRKIRLQRPSCMTFVPLPPSTPGGESRTLVQVQCYVDPGTRHVPPFIISFVLKVLSPFIYGAVKKVLASAFRTPDSPLPQRIKQRAELYDLVRKRTREFLSTLAQKKA